MFGDFIMKQGRQHFFGNKDHLCFWHACVKYFLSMHKLLVKNRRMALFGQTQDSYSPISCFQQWPATCFPKMHTQGTMARCFPASSCMDWKLPDYISWPINLTALAFEKPGLLKEHHPLSSQNCKEN